MLSATVHRLEFPEPPRTGLKDATGTTFRDAMRQIACGVSVITLGAGEDRAGMRATSVCPLSAEPPTLLVCVDRGSLSYPALACLDAFAVNVLAADQREVAEHFAGGSALKGPERFRAGRWLTLPSGLSALADSVAMFECEVDELIERRLHAMVIGRVRRVFAGSGSGALVSWRGSYDQVGWSSDEIARAVGLSPAAALGQAPPSPGPNPVRPHLDHPTTGPA
jgi:flavin reductase (DIM6/NTAB) family NADH-FMN oxidoreductase RutF